MTYTHTHTHTPKKEKTGTTWWSPTVAEPKDAGGIVARSISMGDAAERIDALSTQLMQHRTETAEHLRMLPPHHEVVAHAPPHDAKLDEERRLKAEMCHRYKRWLGVFYMMVSLRMRKTPTDANVPIHEERKKYPDVMAQWAKDIAKKREELRRPPSTGTAPRKQTLPARKRPRTDKEEEKEEETTRDKARKRPPKQISPARKRPRTDKEEDKAEKRPRVHASATQKSSPKQKQKKKTSKHTRQR